MKQSREGVVAYLYRISGLHLMYCSMREKTDRDLTSELVFLNPYGAQESMPRHQLRQPM